jgi:hypothetical protein
MTKSQIPSTKSQTNPKFEFQSGFEFGISNLFGIWCLEFGILTPVMALTNEGDN